MICWLEAWYYVAKSGREVVKAVTVTLTATDRVYLDGAYPRHARQNCTVPMVMRSRGQLYKAEPRTCMVCVGPVHSLDIGIS